MTGLTGPNFDAVDARLLLQTQHLGCKQQRSYDYSFNVSVRLILKMPN